MLRRALANYCKKFFLNVNKDGEIDEDIDLQYVHVMADGNSNVRTKESRNVVFE